MSYIITRHLDFLVDVFRVRYLIVRSTVQDILTRQVLVAFERLFRLAYSLFISVIHLDSSIAHSL